MLFLMTNTIISIHGWVFNMINPVKGENKKKRPLKVGVHIPPYFVSWPKIVMADSIVNYFFLFFSDLDLGTLSSGAL